jgi:adenosine kinase
LEVIARKLSEFPKENKARRRIVIFTQGGNQTIVCLNGEISRFFPTPLNKSEIIDTNGAGDSFVGGFLSRFIQEKPLEECIAAGHYCASECIKQSGCVFPQKPSFSYP